MFDWPLQPEAVRLLPATEVATLEIVRIDLDHKARVLAQRTNVVRCLRSIFSQPAHSVGIGVLSIFTFSVHAVAVQPDRAATIGTTLTASKTSLCVFVPR